MALAPVMCEVYRALAIAARVKWNHKVSNRIAGSKRAEMGDGKVGKQVAVTHNEGQLEREMKTQRRSFEEFMA